jgi:hypothetical protein
MQPTMMYAYQLSVLVAALIPINPFISRPDGISRTLSNTEVDDKVERAVQLLIQAHHDLNWSRYYIGSWPAFLLGLRVSRIDHINLVRHDLEMKSSATSFWEYRRMLDTLELFWVHNKPQ